MRTYIHTYIHAYIHTCVQWIPISPPQQFVLKNVGRLMSLGIIQINVQSLESVYTQNLWRIEGFARSSGGLTRMHFSCVRTDVLMYRCTDVLMYRCTDVQYIICTDMYVRTYVCMYIRMYICTCRRTDVLMYRYVCMCAWMYVRTYVCTYRCTDVQMYSISYVCTYVRVSNTPQEVCILEERY